MFTHLLSASGSPRRHDDREHGSDAEPQRGGSPHRPGPGAARRPGGTHRLLTSERASERAHVTVNDAALCPGGGGSPFQPEALHSGQGLHHRGQPGPGPDHLGGSHLVPVEGESALLLWDFAFIATDVALLQELAASESVFDVFHRLIGQM